MPMISDKDLEQVAGGYGGNGPRCYPHLEEDMCIGCGMCEANCPAQAITVDYIAQIDLGACIENCGECEISCMTGAIRVY